MPRTRVAWALLAVSLLAVSAPGATPGAREDGAAAGHGHPSCAVGRLLARQADLGEAVLALEMCRRHAPSVAAVRNLAAAYIDTGRTALARQTLLQLVEDGRSGPDELCRARLSLAELRMADGGGRCDLLRVELDAADEACREASGQAFAQDLLRVRAEAHLECSNASTDDADAERAVARAAAAHRPASARSWRTLCFSPLLHGKLQEQRGKMEEQRARITPRHVPELVDRPCGHGEEAAHALACLLLVVGGSQVKRASKGLDVHVGEAGLARWARSPGGEKYTWARSTRSLAGLARSLAGLARADLREGFVY